VRPKLSGKILFVFSDPGGAKPCLSLIEENSLTEAIAVSDRQYPFYNDFKTHVRIENQNFEQLVDSINPELIFTGTSYTSNIENQFIKIAQNKNIPCYSFVDHWTSISRRFYDSSEKMILPDKVWVIDERAREIAIQEDIDKTKIIISGNPYHDWLRNWKPSISKEVFLKQLHLHNLNTKLLVYAPDPLSNVKGKEVYGFDELSASTDLVELFKTHQKELNQWNVLVKAHPNQDRSKLNEIFERHNAFYLLSEKIDTNTIIYYADVVMGFFSSFLIEAAILNKPVLRFIDERTIYDPILEINVGITTNKNTFIEILSKISK